MVDNVKKLETDFKQLQFPQQESVGKKSFLSVTDSPLCKFVAHQPSLITAIEPSE